LSPFALLGCGGSPDGSNVEVGDLTKAEAQSRAEGYKERAALKKKAKSKR
jgi:hypothetical protein